jgi:hypothetical protein
MLTSPRPAGLVSPHSGLGRYLVVRALSESASAAVYEVSSAIEPNRCAAKVLRLEGHHGEVEALGQAALVQHGSLPTVLSWGALPGMGAYIVYEWLEGHDLATELANRIRPMTIERALLWIEGPAQALTAAHERGLLHLDLRPEHLCLCTSRKGHEAAKLLGLGASARWAARLSETPFEETLVSARYVAPEQVYGRVLDGRADVFALAAIVYEALAGRPAFAGPSIEATLLARVLKPPPSLRMLNRAVTPEVERVILRGLAPEPAHRPATPNAFVRELLRASEAGERSIPMGPVLAMVPESVRRSVPDASRAEEIARGETRSFVHEVAAAIAGPPTDPLRRYPWLAREPAAKKAAKNAAHAAHAVKKAARDAGPRAAPDDLIGALVARVRGLRAEAPPLRRTLTEEDLVPQVRRDTERAGVPRAPRAEWNPLTPGLGESGPVRAEHFTFRANAVLRTGEAPKVEARRLEAPRLEAPRPQRPRFAAWVPLAAALAVAMMTVVLALSLRLPESLRGKPLPPLRASVGGEASPAQAR